MDREGKWNSVCCAIYPNTRVRIREKKGRRKAWGRDGRGMVISAIFVLFAIRSTIKGTFCVALNIQSRRTVKISNCFDLRLKATFEGGTLSCTFFNVRMLHKKERKKGMRDTSKERYATEQNIHTRVSIDDAHL